MKACVLHAKGDLRYEDYADPKITEPKEVIVKIQRGGFCGSDVHYYKEGGVGSAIIVREPLIIGHEGTGIVAEVGSDVKNVKVGDAVAIRPARPCFDCYFCKKGQYSFCEKMRHLGSAALMPHTAGLFAEKVLVHEAQLKVVHGLDPKIGAFAEPLAVAYNGIRTLGELFGKNLLIMGGGPIGCLCVAAARQLGAASITVIDIAPKPLEMAKAMGADVVCNSKENPDQIAKWKEHKGYFDLMADATGNMYAVVDAMAMTKPMGICSQVGMFGPGRNPDPSLMCNKALQWRGVFRFYDEFPAAVNALECGAINPLPLLSAEFKAEDCVKGMEAAISPETSKVQLVFS